jgi:hypothetical protein
VALWAGSFLISISARFGLTASACQHGAFGALSALQLVGGHRHVRSDKR